jgi:hypothetical protein
VEATKEGLIPDSVDMGTDGTFTGLLSAWVTTKIATSPCPGAEATRRQRSGHAVPTQAKSGLEWATIQLVNAFGASGKVVNGMGLHDDSTDTYNGGSCQEPENPWVFTSYYNGVPISWGADAVTSLTNILGKKTQ